GCPLDLDFDPKRPAERGLGWMLDDARPTLTLAEPRAGSNAPLTRLLLGMHDYYSGLDLKSFTVSGDFDIDGAPAGANLASRFKLVHPGVYELKLARPITLLRTGKLTVSVRDHQGNITRIERTFSVK